MADKLQKPPSEMQHLLYSMAYNPDGGPVRRWIERHAADFGEMDPMLVHVSPEAGVVVLRAKRMPHLFSSPRNDWKMQAEALALMAPLDPSLVMATVEAHRESITARVTNLSGLDSEEMAPFLLEMEKLKPGFMMEVLQRVDPVLAADRWLVALNDAHAPHRKGARAMCSLVAKYGPDALKAVAIALLRAPRKRRRRRT